MNTTTNTSHSIKSELKNTYSLGIPLIASQLIYSSSGFVATAMVARLGQAALAASVLVSIVWMSLTVLFFGMLNAVCVLVSHQYGARNDKGISDIMGQSFILCLIIFILMMATLCSMPFLLRWSGQPANVLTLAYQYVHALLWTIPGLIILVMLEQFLAGISRTKIVLRISLLVVPVEIPLIYILIFGKLGLPACGIAGVGYGFATTYTITAICLLYYLLKAPYFQRFGIFNSINKINFTHLKELIVVGLPMGFMNLIELSAFALATFWLGHFGTTMLAAHQIILQYLAFTITLVFAMSQAVTIRVGHAVGRQDLSGVRYAVYIGMLANFICVFVVAASFWLMPTVFLSMDINIHLAANAALIHDASLLLGICGVLVIFDNFRIIGFGALRGLKDTRFPMYASFISFWLIGINAAYLFAFHFHMQGSGIWWGLTLGIASGAIIVFTRLQYILRTVDLKKILSIYQ